MTKPQEPKRYNMRLETTVFGVCFQKGDYMLAEEALAYAEAVRNEAHNIGYNSALEAAAKMVEAMLGGNNIKHEYNFAPDIRSLKREGK